MITLNEIKADAQEDSRLVYAVDSTWWTHDVGTDCTRFPQSPLPHAPNGAVLMETPLKSGLAEAERAPGHYGEGGLDLFMFTHHRNCAGACFKTWDEARAAWKALGSPSFT